MHNITISKLKASEWEKYKKLRLEAVRKEPSAFGESYKEVTESTDKEWRKRLKIAVNEDCAIMLFAKDKDKVVGMIGVYWTNKEKLKHIANIFGVYVTNSYRQQGIGKLLMEAMLEKISSMPQFIKVKLSVGSKRKEAIKLYKRFGYRIMGIKKKEIKLNEEYFDSYSMEKLI